ncbi:MAG: LytTR family DNA-binding domain-containing protein [Bacteroidota bacterium]
MLSSNYNIKHLRFIIASNKRSFTDTVTWLVFFFLTLGFCTLHFLNMYYTEDPDCNFLEFVINNECLPTGKRATPVTAFVVLLRNSLVYTVFMMIPVYFNLLVLKKYMIDDRQGTVLSYIPYLFASLVNALLFAWFMHFIYSQFPGFMNVKFRYLVNVLTIFGTQLVATGLLFRRETLEYIRELEKAKRREQKVKEEIVQLKEKLQDIEISVDSNVLKVGTKKSYKIIQLKDILYLQGDGNEPLIFTNDSIRKYRGSKSMSDYKEHLPAERFIQVHRSYIVAKDKVIGRKGNVLILRDCDVEIPISKSYEDKVDQDEYIGFQPDVDKIMKALKNT